MTYYRTDYSRIRNDYNYKAQNDSDNRHYSVKDLTRGNKVT